MSTYYSKAFCISCLKDCNRTGGTWKQKLFICVACRKRDKIPADPG